MRHRSNTTIAAMVLAAKTAVHAASPTPPASDGKREFQLQDTHTAQEAQD